jgi:hypothetical protein
LAIRIRVPTKQSISIAILPADHDIARQRVFIKAAVVMPPMLALANDHI